MDMNRNSWIPMLFVSLLLLFLCFSASAKENVNKIGSEKEKAINVFDFKETPLNEVVKVFTELSGKNVLANNNIRNLNITLFLKNVTWKRSLEMLCEQYNLWYKEDNNYIRLMKIKDYDRTISVGYKGKYHIFNLKYASATSVAEAISSLMGDSVKYLGAGGDSYSYIKKGKISYGERVGGADVKRKIEIPEIGWRIKAVEEIEEKKHKIEQKLKKEKEKIEKQKMEAEIEKIEEEMTKFEKRESVAYIRVYLPNNCIIAYCMYKELTEEISALIQKLDIPTRQVLIEGKILKVNVGHGFSSFFNFIFEKGKHKAEMPIKEIASSTLSYTFTNLPELLIKIRLLESEGRIETIGTPMILTANNAPAEIFIGEEIPITKNYEFEVREFEHKTTETIRPVITLEDIGTTLNITPVINEDKTVTLLFKLDISSVVEDGGKINLINDKGEIVILRVDTVNTSNIDTIFSVPDGKALAIGGLVEETDKLNELKVPLLGDIPLLGNLFKRQEHDKEKTELVMIIVPHIIMSPKEGESVSKKTLKDISEHPYIKKEQKKILYYDEKRKKLKSIGTLTQTTQNETKRTQETESTDPQIINPHKEENKKETAAIKKQTKSNTVKKTQSTKKVKKNCEKTAVKHEYVVKNYVLQVSSCLSKKAVSNTVLRLKKYGHKAFTEEKIINSKKYTRVMVGPTKGYLVAKKEAMNIKSQLKLPYMPIVKRYDKIS